MCLSTPSDRPTCRPPPAQNTWDYSAWIRAYSVYLDERLGVFKSMKFDPELESATAITGVRGLAHG